MRVQPPMLSFLVALAALSVSAAGAASTSSGAQSGKGIAYRWVDEQGIVHYGDRIPPQYAEKERTVLNGQGVAIDHVDAAKTPEQLATEARERQELLKQKQHDSFLVTTYTSVKDIEALRDIRLDQLKGQRLAAEQYVENLRARLASLQSRALQFRPYDQRPEARRMPDDLAEDLVRTLSELRSQTNALVVKGEEEATLRAQFQADIERYRELHATAAQGR